MVECCGKPRATPFCPQCGKRLGDAGPLVQLLSHCRVQQASHEGRSRRTGGPGPDGSDMFLRHAEKWKAWGDALAALIGGDE